MKYMRLVMFEQLPEERRERVYDALLTRNLAVGQWVDSLGNPCALAVAATAAAGLSSESWLWDLSSDGKYSKVAEILGSSSRTIQHAISEWDYAHDPDRQAFLREVRVRLDLIRASRDQEPPQVPIRKSLPRVRELVVAVLFLLGSAF